MRMITHLSKTDLDFENFIKSLEKYIALINWLECNQIKFKPDKFQALAVGKKPRIKTCFNLSRNKINCKIEVKLLGVTIDFEIKFNNHISNICKKASRQLNVLKMLGKYQHRLPLFHSF